MEMVEKWFMTQTTPEEQALKEKVCVFESLFGDMLFKQGTSTYELILCKSKLEESDEWSDFAMGLPEELEYFSYSWFDFKVESLEDDHFGVYNHKNQTLTISPESLEKDSIILHELIHLHENVINEFPMYFHDMVYWSLYKDLKDKIPELDEIVTNHAHLLTGSTIHSAGGTHDILFLLKSFDLDIRKGYPLGTVFGYGAEDDFKEYTYIADTI